MQPLNKPFSIEDLKQQYLLGQVVHVNMDFERSFYFANIRGGKGIEENFEEHSCDMRKFNRLTAPYLTMVSVTYKKLLSKEEFDAKGIPITQQEYDCCFKAINYSSKKLMQTDDPTDQTIVHSLIDPKAALGNIFQKSGDDALEEELEQGLQKAGIKAIVLTGSYMDACILATAQTALQKGYNVVFITDLLRSHKMTSKDQAIVENEVYIKNKFAGSTNVLSMQSTTLVNTLDITKSEDHNNLLPRMLKRYGTLEYIGTN